MGSAASEWIKDVGEAEFEKEVVERSGERPVVVDFWAPWCPPCRMLGPLLERAVAERKGEVVLAKVNLDEAPNLAARFRVEAIPTVLAFRDGKLVLEFTGLLPEPRLREFLDRLSPSEAELLVKQARDMETTRPAEAEGLYRNALAAERGNEAAMLGLARVLLAQGKEDEAAEWLEPLGPGSEHGEEAEHLRAQMFLRRQAREFGDENALKEMLAKQPDDADGLYRLGCVLAAAGAYQEALEKLLAAAEKDTKLATAKVREVMVRIFYAIGVRHPLADEYRAKLSRLLY